MTQPASLASRWEHFPHGADIGVAGVGPTKAEAFRQAALALTAVITEPERVRPTSRVDIECRGANDDLLLVEWLNALIYEMAVRSMLFGRFAVSVEDGVLRAS